uniref:AIG1-type G domain-containing protein n=1 Tax=Sparus aurata TaxID=8175 RepID=A0A671X3Q4_SPAAU
PATPHGGIKGSNIPIVKSWEANSILGENTFKSEFSFDSLTKQCNKAFGEVDGQKVAVIDTPGLFDTCKGEEKIKRDIAQCIFYASPGPHIFLIVIQLGRFTEEEKRTVQKIQEIFGEEADKYSMVLFTHGDLLKKGGRHYTTEMFQEAEKKIEEEKQRILKENEEQRLKEQEELKREIEKKYEEEMKKINADREKEKTPERSS